MKKVLVIIFIQMALLIILVSSQGEMMRKPMAIETPTVGGADERKKLERLCRSCKMPSFSNVRKPD